MKPFISILFLLITTQLPAADITGETVWSGAVSVTATTAIRQGTLTINPGTVVTFTGTGNLTLMPNTTLMAVGTVSKPITFVGQQAGTINARNATVQFEHCQFEGLGGTSKYAIQISGNANSSSLLRRCQLTNMKAVAFSGEGLAIVNGCDFRAVSDGIELNTRGSEITDNTLRDSSIKFSRADAPVTVRNNVIVDGMIWGLHSEKGHTETILVESNYVRNIAIAQNYGLLRITGTIRRNITRGAMWSCCDVGGIITENIFESYTRAEIDKLAAVGQKISTHENILSPVNGTRITHNLFLQPSFGAIMGMGGGQLTDCLIEYNTFDLKSGPVNGIFPIYLNHLSKSPFTNLVARYNLFLRTGAIHDEKGFTNSLFTCDYNLWAETFKDRFSKIVMSGTQPGDDGFGGHDVPSLTEKKLRAVDVVANPDFVFPFSDEDLLARKHSVAECLDLYRAAYRLKAGQPAWGAVK